MLGRSLHHLPFRIYSRAGKSFELIQHQDIRCSFSSVNMVGANAVELLKKNGYVILKKPPNVKTSDLLQVRHDVLGYAKSLVSSFKYRLWRFFNRVHTSQQRHSIPLPIFDTKIAHTLPKVVEIYVKEVAPILGEIFEGFDAKLVELAALVSYPGATSQKIHSDMQYTDKTKIISCFIALKDVTAEDGPTTLFPETHTKAFHERNTAAYSMEKVTFSADGERESNEDIRYSTSIESIPSNNTMDDLEASKLARFDGAKQALLCAGDILLFDTTIFHFGEANQSDIPRVLLGFAFQSNRGDNNACFEIDKSNGFTYHINPDVQLAELKLFDFDLTKSATTTNR